MSAANKLKWGILVITIAMTWKMSLKISPEGQCLRSLRSLALMLMAAARDSTCRHFESREGARHDGDFRGRGVHCMA